MITASRLAAAHALHAVHGEGRPVFESWDRDLSGEDAVFAQALLGQALRRWGRLQAWVQPQLKDPARGVPLGTQVALALGLAQLAWLEGVASHAAVNEAVALVAHRELGFPPHRGLVNAILRRAASDRVALRAALEALPAALDRTPFAERVLRAALERAEGDVETLWARWQRPPRPAFHALRGAVPPGLVPDPGLPGSLALAEGESFPRAWLASGAGMVQDRSSQALMAFAWDRPVGRMLDACAAPGGKTTALARRFPEAALFAVEQDPRRAARLRENLAARQVEAQLVEAEAGAWLARGGKPFDLILLDAPCSGSGTLQKHPELVWTGGAVDLARLAGLQRALLAAAMERLAPGGLLIYAVCSWLPEEGERHRRWLLGAHPELRPAEVWPERGGAVFTLDPMTWEGEGFQAFAVTR